MSRHLKIALICLPAIFLGVGCGTTKSRVATQQMLISAAVDECIANIDFRPLAGKKIFFDTAYLNNVKGMGFVNADYIISSLRQQMIAADCRLQEKEDTADFIVEARVGTLGVDGNDIVYGLPASTGLSTAASLLPNAPPIPAIPEISIARKQAEQGAAKVAVFAYDKETRSPVWQSGLSHAKSSAQDFWMFGAGPFQRGSIYEKTQFAGQELRIPRIGDRGDYESQPRVALYDEYLFDRDDDPKRVAQKEKLRKLVEELPHASAEEWLTPLKPTVTTPIDQRLEWRR